MDKEAVLLRIDELHGFDSNDIASINRALAGILTVMQLVHGPDSLHLQHLKTIAADAQVQYAKLGLPVVKIRLVPVLRGFLDSLRSDVAAGLSLTGEQRGFGAALSDFIGLAKHALDERTVGSKNVAAVLAAASFEDTIRRMGSSLAGVTGSPKVASIVEVLKQKHVLQGAEVKFAQGCEEFRNDALHARWEGIERATVQGCVNFVESLLTKYFS